MKAQCPCVSGEDRTPDPSCEKCQGTGFREVSFPSEDELAAIWLGRCPECGASNGMHFQRKGKPLPQPDPYWKCVNPDCQRPPVELVQDIDVTAWFAVCSVCSTIHFADFLQRADDAPPTNENNPRTCPNDDCGSSDMMWVTEQELEENE